MTPSPPSTTVAPPRRRRRLLRWVVPILLPVLLGVAGVGYLWYAGDRALREAEAETDRLDPGWRLADLEAAQAPVPNAENSAPQVRAVRTLLPTPWLPPPAEPDLAPDDRVGRLPPPVRLDDALAARLRTELGKVAPARAAARRLVDFPHGRYPIVWSSDAVGTPMPHLDDARQVARLLQLDAVLRAHDGDADGALASYRALLNAERSIGDEPAAISQLVRMAGQRMARRSLERALAQGEPSDAALAAVQRLLEDEERAPLQLVAARSERAAIHQFLEVAEAGRLDAARLGIRSQTGSTTVDGLLDRATARSTHVAYLRYLNELVEISKLPPEQQAERFREFYLKPPKGVPRLLDAITRGDDFPVFAERFRTERGLLRCAIAAVAAERYRRAHGSWPDGLDALAPAYLAAVPTDPSDGRPLRWRRLADGVAVELSVPPALQGAEAADDAGAERPRTDGGFRLWDVAHRRQPPREK